MFVVTQQIRQAVVRIGVHRPELQNLKRSRSITNPRLAIEDRATGVDQDGHCHE
jgi:hypothetical protein